jgi:hypothetical protein
VVGEAAVFLGLFANTDSASRGQILFERPPVSIVEVSEEHLDKEFVTTIVEIQRIDPNLIQEEEECEDHIRLPVIILTYENHQILKGDCFVPY